jgi:hypothetical protein
VSKFCLQNSPIPVIVVRPNSQRARGKRKRQADKTRRQYRDLLDVGASEEQLGIHKVPLEPSSTNEAAAVAEAIGVPLAQAQQATRMSRLSQVQSASDQPLVIPPTIVKEHEPDVNGNEDEPSPGTE